MAELITWSQKKIKILDTEAGQKKFCIQKLTSTRKQTEDESVWSVVPLQNKLLF